MSKRSNAVMRFVTASMLMLTMATQEAGAVTIPGWPSDWKVPIPIPSSISGLGVGGGSTGISAPAAAANQWIEKKLGGIISTQLPINLNANHKLPTIDPGDLTGGEFNPARAITLHLTTDNLKQPLAPGDYIIPVIAFCMEYSIHRGGPGYSFALGPLEGRNARAVAELLLRGVSGSHPVYTGQLQTASWAIQSGLPYTQMPPDVRQTIDRLIPEHRKELSGNYVQRIEQQYAQFASHIPNAPSFDNALNQLGSLGGVVHDAMSLQSDFQQHLTDTAMRNQVLYQGQGAQLPPIPEENGPWSIVAGGRAYAKLHTVQGNLGSNELWVRVLPQHFSSTHHRLELAARISGGMPELASYAPAASTEALTGVSADAVLGVGAAAVTAIGGPYALGYYAAAGLYGYLAYGRQPVQVLYQVPKIGAGNKSKAQAPAIPTALSETDTRNKKNRCYSDMSLSNNAFVVRGGGNEVINYLTGSSVFAMDTGLPTANPVALLDGISVASLNGLGYIALAKNMPQRKIAFSTVGVIRADGGNVYPEGASPHAHMCGISASRASMIMKQNLIDNPWKNGK